MTNFEEASLARILRHKISLVQSARNTPKHMSNATIAEKFHITIAEVIERMIQMQTNKPIA